MKLEAHDLVNINQNQCMLDITETTCLKLSFDRQQQRNPAKELNTQDGTELQLILL